MNDSIEQVLRTYFGAAHISSCKQLGGGEINTSWLVTCRSKRYIMQRLSPIFAPTMCIDSETVLEALRHLGWNVAKTKRTRNQKLYYIHDDYLWRVQYYIDSDERIPEIISPSLSYQLGVSLASLHRDLRTISYRPKFSLPHFHDTSYYLSQLDAITPAFTHPLHRSYTYKILALFESLPTLPTSSKQLIHGDPRLNNILFRDQQPYSYIDWDTLMIGTIWIDIGDSIRSYIEDSLRTQSPPTNLIDEFCRGYHSGYAAKNYNLFRSRCYQTALTITLELAARYMIDIVEDKYFKWNSARYNSRAESNFQRVQETMAVYDVIIARQGGLNA